MEHQPRPFQSRAWSGASMLAGISTMTRVKHELPDTEAELQSMVEVGASAQAWFSSNDFVECQDLEQRVSIAKSKVGELLRAIKSFTV